MTEDQIQSTFPSNRFTPMLITEVTRMSKGMYCVAGWDVHGQRMIRPLNAFGQNWKLSRDRSVFAVGHLINFRETGKRGTVFPHATEDSRLSRDPTFLASLDESDTHAILLDKCQSTLRELFGQELVEDKYLLEHTKCPSLGGVRIERRCTEFFQDGYKLRLRVDDSDGTIYRLPVTCDTLRHMFSPSDDDCESHFGVPEANQWLSATPEREEIILRIGLARGWVGPDKDWNPHRCYAQLNGIICPSDNYHIFSDVSV